MRIKIIFVGLKSPSVIVEMWYYNAKLFLEQLSSIWFPNFKFQFNA